MKKNVRLLAIPLIGIMFFQLIKIILFTHPVIVPFEKYIKSETKYVKDMAISDVGPNCSIEFHISKKMSFEEAQEIFKKSVVFLEKENLYKDICLYREDNNESIIVNFHLVFFVKNRVAYEFITYPSTKENAQDSLRGLVWKGENALTGEKIEYIYE